VAKTGSIKIDKKVPVPKGRSRKYPFLDMSVGDSFSVPEVDHNRVRTACQYYKKHHSMEFRTQIYSHQGKRRVRVWRTK
jgi:hypothetical protein